MKLHCGSSTRSCSRRSTQLNTPQHPEPAHSRLPTMIAQRLGLRAAPRVAAQLRAPAQRRLASSTSAKAGENAFLKEREDIKHHAHATTDLWRKISIYGVAPAIILAGLNAYNLWNEHWEHWSHMPPLEERVQYSYQNIRTKNFTWGDGDKTLFWNESVNHNKKD